MITDKSGKYEQLESTGGVQLVSVEEFTTAFLKNQTRGYNVHSVVFKDDYMMLSGVVTFGIHQTLVLTKEMTDRYFDNNKTIKEAWADILQNDYAWAYEKWVREDERDKIIKLIEELKNVKD